MPLYYFLNFFINSIKIYYIPMMHRLWTGDKGNSLTSWALHLNGGREAVKQFEFYAHAQAYESQLQEVLRGMPRVF
jgi:hypothetical protein